MTRRFVHTRWRFCHSLSVILFINQVYNFYLVWKHRNMRASFFSMIKIEQYGALNSSRKILGSGRRKKRIVRTLKSKTRASFNQFFQVSYFLKFQEHVRVIVRAGGIFCYGVFKLILSGFMKFF